MSPVVEPDEDPVVYVARIVSAAVADRSVCVGRRHVNADRDIWIAARHLIRWCDEQRIVPPFTINALLLRRAVRHGLLQEREGSRPPQFTTRAKWAEAFAELSLTHGERAERTAAAVRSEFERNRRTYGDRAQYWAVDPNLMAVPDDGVEPAVDSGLLCRSGVAPFSGRLVPAECFDAFMEAVQLEQQRESTRKAHHQSVEARLLAVAGPALRDEHSVRLSTSQAERLLALLSD